MTEQDLRELERSRLPRGQRLTIIVLPQDASREEVVEQVATRLTPELREAWLMRATLIAGRTISFMRTRFAAREYGFEVIPGGRRG